MSNHIFLYTSLLILYCHVAHRITLQLPFSLSRSLFSSHFSQTFPFFLLLSLISSIFSQTLTISQPLSPTYLRPPLPLMKKPKSYSYSSFVVFLMNQLGFCSYVFDHHFSFFDRHNSKWKNKTFFLLFCSESLSFSFIFSTLFF